MQDSPDHWLFSFTDFQYTILGYAIDFGDPNSLLANLGERPTEYKGAAKIGGCVPVTLLSEEEVSRCG